MDLTTGDVLDRFRVEARLGSSGLATVFRARDTESGDEVALKVLRPYLSAGSKGASEWLEVIGKIAALSCNRIARVVAWGKSDVPWVATQLGIGSLADHSEPMPPRLVDQVVSDIAEAIDAAHSAGMLHLDLKPSNVLVDEEGRWLLTDFGMPLVAAGVDPLVRAIGRTPLAAFMPPEYTEGKGATRSSDIYSLGVLAFWLISGGRLPYAGIDSATVAANQARGNAPHVSDIDSGVPRGFGDVISQALSRSPDARPDTAAEFSSLLRRAADAAPERLEKETGSSGRQVEEIRQFVPATVTRTPDTPDHRKPSRANRTSGWPGSRRTSRGQRGIVLALTGLLVGGSILAHLFTTGSSIAVRPGVSSVSSEQTWSMNQGDPVHSGILPGPGPQLAGEAAWSLSRAGRISHEPVVADGTVYWSPGDRSFVALDAATGESLWELLDFGFVNVTPAYADGKLYVAIVEGIVALDGSTGEEIWRLPAQGPNDSAPLVKDGVVYVGTGGGKIYALDAATGDEFWNFETGGVFSTSPAISEEDILVSATRDGDVHVFNGRNGLRRLRYQLPATSEGAATIVGDVAFIGAANGRMFALNLDERRRLFDAQSFWLRGQFFAFGFSDQLPTQRGFERSIKLEQGQTIASSPIAHESSVYVTTLNGRVYALDSETFDIRWQRDVGNSSPGSSVLAGGTIYVATDTSLLGLRITDGAELWRWNLDLAGAGLVESPVITTNGAYVVALELSPEIVISNDGKDRWFFHYRESACLADGPSSSEGPFATKLEAESLAIIRAPTCSTLIALK